MGARVTEFALSIMLLSILAGSGAARAEEAWELSAASRTWPAAEGRSEAQTGYFEQFLYERVGSCARPEEFWFKSAHSWRRAPLGEDAQGRAVFAELSVQLFRDGTYWARYSEVARQEPGSGEESCVTLFTRTLEGAWRVSGDRLELSELGHGVPSWYSTSWGEPRPGFRFTLTRALNNGRALGASLSFGRSGTTEGPRGASVEQVCPTVK